MLGGSFDPPHIGPVLAAVDGFGALALDGLVFIPAAIHPLKVARGVAAGSQRLAVLRLLVGDVSGCAVDAIEVEREGVSFSVDTVAVYADRYPAAERFFLVGADVVESFGSWRDPERIAQLATIVVVRRGEEAPAAPSAIESVASRLLRTRRVDVSSTEIRPRIGARKSVHRLLPPAPTAFIPPAT